MEHPPTRQRAGEVSQRKGRWDGVMRPRSSKGGQYFRVQDRAGRYCLRALAGHDTNVEFTPEGHRELLKAFRQKSVRIKQAFVKARSSCAMGSRTWRERARRGEGVGATKG